MSKLLFLQWFSQQFLPAFCWTLLHSLWQGLIVSLLAGIVIYCTKRASSQLRYNLLLGMLLLFIGSSIVTFTYLVFQTERTISAHTSVTSITGAVGSLTAASFVMDGGEPFFTNRLVLFLNQNAASVFLIWLMLFIVHVLRLLAGLRYINYIRHHNISVPPFEWKNKIKCLSNQLQIKQAVMLLQSELVKIPVVIGWLKPVILVPLGFLASLPADQVEAILLHELAHVSRKDYLMNLLQSIADTVFFFNPAFLWLSSRIRQEREACCDDKVIFCTGNKKSYVEALLYFQENNQASGFAMALGRKKNHLLNRVKRMLYRENIKLNTMEKIVLLAGSVVLLTAFNFISNSSYNEPVGKKAHPAVLQLQYQDTVPTPKNENKEVEQDSSKLIENEIVANEDEEKNIIVQPSGAKEKKYKVVKKNGKTVLLQIDGKPIPKKDYQKYNDLDQQLKYLQMKEAYIEKQKALQDLKEQKMQVNQDINEKLLVMEKSKRDRQIKLDKMKFKTDHQFELAEKIALEQKQNYLLELNDYQQKQELLKKDIELDKKLQLNENYELAYNEGRKKYGSNSTITAIIDDLKDAHIIDSEDPLSFSLNNKELIVNGKKQPENIFQQLKGKYLHSAGDSFNYSHQGGSTQTVINTDK